MPRGDGTGPNGQGSKTGRGLGKCGGNSKAGYLNNTQPRNNRNKDINQGNRNSNKGNGRNRNN